MSSIAKWPRQVTIRRAHPSDRRALDVLATLDGAPALRGDVLVAEVPHEGGPRDGRLELWAAAAIDGSATAADPFRASGELALLLAERARAIRHAERGPLAPGRTLLARLRPAR